MRNNINTIAVDQESQKYVASPPNTNLFLETIMPSCSKNITSDV